jgi:hypothetical protein
VRGGNSLSERNDEALKGTVGNTFGRLNINQTP